MQLSRNWLGDYVELPDTVEELARRLTAAGHAVDQVEESGDDVVLDIDITTNRSDCMNHLGMAREIAVLFDRPLEAPSTEVVEVSDPAREAATLEIEDPILCRRYVGRVVRGVKIGPSPDWLRSRLESIGVRSINNVVDVTNYVLWETGQPQHAFDLKKLSGATIKVRRARAGETLVTLDGETRKLDPEMLIVADDSVPVALAGVMGGLDSEVTEATTEILLESAFFDPSAVRRTAGQLGMHTDASHRFERGADPEAAAWAADRAAALIVKVAGGEVLEGSLDVYPSPMEPCRIEIEHERLVAFAGAPIPAERIEAWLEGLGCGLEKKASGAWSVTVPSWRWNDLELKADVYEEAIRIYGIDDIPATLPGISGVDAGEEGAGTVEDRLRRHLAACGYCEAITFAFHDGASDAAFPGLYPEEEPLRLANALSERYSVMRRSLLPNLLESARFNQRRGAESIHLFEIGHVFARGPERSQEDLASGPSGSQEKGALALVVGGTPGTTWEGARELDFFDLKGALESFGAIFGSSLGFRPTNRPFLVPGCAAEILSGERVVGYCGRWTEEEGSYPLFLAEVETSALAGHRLGAPVDVPSKFPGVGMDLTLTHSLDTSWQSIEEAVESLAPEDLEGCLLRDRYTGDGVPAGAVNTTIHFFYNAPDRSLTQEEVNERHSSLVGALESRFSWVSEQGKD